MLDHLNSTQLSEWEAYDRLDPIGTWREDFRMAFLASLITNLTISIHGRKGTKATELMDFMPKWDITAPKEIKRQGMEEMKQALIEIANAQNRNVAKQGNKQINKRKP